MAEGLRHRGVIGTFGPPAVKLTARAGIQLAIMEIRMAKASVDTVRAIGDAALDTAVAIPRSLVKIDDNR